ncbi:hypothetical protein RFI_01495 [Reticulomyxa filosa]|uniref:Uncharacterized protein n=1 Tax=Reticulomyxa filosa TaxID=46433 RepID=X6PBS2_RETFI|nr:hypothetical protein RFI_01495 [Reticulomyxa filosa]|eukprot:ETO35568.1 hypothetical protein RFI_01495 [Reticulomyxa filosa]
MLNIQQSLSEKEKKTAKAFNPELNNIEKRSNSGKRKRNQRDIGRVWLFTMSKCFKLNHIARDCPTKGKKCKYCGSKTTKHRSVDTRIIQVDIDVYVLCKKNHPSDSVQCEVIRKAREKLEIKLTRKEESTTKHSNRTIFNENKRKNNNNKVVGHQLCPDQKKPSLFCSFYRNLQCNHFNLQAFEQELQYTLPFDCTYMKDNAISSIDNTLCTSYILPLISNWKTNDVELDVQSYHPTNHIESNKWEECRLRLKKNIDNWMKYIDPIEIELEKYQHMVNSINSLHEGNIRNLFTQFKALNTNKICVILALVNKQINSVSRSDADKAYLLAKTFAEPPQPPKGVVISKPLESDEN